MTVIGDADLLTEAYAGAPQAAPAPGLVPVDTAVQAILGVVSRASSGNAFFPDEVARGIGEQDGLPGSARSQKELARVEDLSAREISEVLAGRLRKGVQRRYRKQRRRLQRIADRHAVSLPRARDRSGDEVLHTAAADTPDQFG